MKILIIEDNKATLEHLIFYLKDIEEHDVVGVESAEAALEHLFSDYKPDVILLDLRLTLTQGEQLLEFAKKIDKLKNVPVIIISAITEPEIVEKLKEIGVHAYLTKPLSLLELKKRLDEIQKIK